MKKSLFTLLCMVFFTQFAYAQFAYPGHIPTAEEFKKAGENAVKNHIYTGPANVSTNTSNNRNSTRSTVVSSRTDKPCPVCRGDKKCISYTYITNVGYCHGSGTCRACSGSGYMQNPYGGIGDKIKCTYCWTGKVGKCGRCHGTGKCSSCNGTGKL